MERVFLYYLGNSIELDEGETVLGRDLSCRMRFNDARVSRLHLRLHVSGGTVEAEDAGSRNGTFINGERLEGRRRLQSGDEITLGGRALRVQIVPADGPSPAGDTDIDAVAVPPPLSMLPLPQVPRSVPRGQHKCPECRQPVSIEEDVCGLCGYSWGDFRPRATTRPVDLTALGRPEERRRHARHRVEIPVVYRSEYLEVESLALDLSRSGAFIRTQVLDPVGTECTVTMLVDGAPAVTLEGRVARTVEVELAGGDPLGLGVQFVRLDTTTRSWLDEIIARAGTPPPPRRG